MSSNRKLPADLITKVQQFFARDSVSRQAPGIRNYVIVQQEGKKIKLQKRHLVLSLCEVHALFVNEFPEVEISLGKFCSLRPDNVVFSKMPRNVCLFQHYDNVNLLCSSLHKVVPEFPADSSTLVSSLVCDAGSEECMTGKCKKCPIKLEEIVGDAHLDKPLEWFQWERKECKITIKKGVEKISKRVMKVRINGTVKEAINSLSKKMPAFLEHVFIK